MWWCGTFVTFESNGAEHSWPVNVCDDVGLSWHVSVCDNSRHSSHVDVCDGEVHSWHLNLMMRIIRDTLMYVMMRNFRDMLMYVICGTFVTYFRIIFFSSTNYHPINAPSSFSYHQRSGLVAYRSAVPTVAVLFHHKNVESKFLWGSTVICIIQ
jgi:hypothetical protein